MMRVWWGGVLARGHCTQHGNMALGHLNVGMMSKSGAECAKSEAFWRGGPFLLGGLKFLLGGFKCVFARALFLDNQRVGASRRGRSNARGAGS